MLVVNKMQTGSFHLRKRPASFLVLIIIYIYSCVNNFFRLLAPAKGSNLHHYKACTPISCGFLAFLEMITSTHCILVLGNLLSIYGNHTLLHVKLPICRPEINLLLIFLLYLYIYISIVFLNLSMADSINTFGDSLSSHISGVKSIAYEAAVQVSTPCDSL